MADPVGKNAEISAGEAYGMGVAASLQPATSSQDRIGSRAQIEATPQSPGGAQRDPSPDGAANVESVRGGPELPRGQSGRGRVSGRST